jgi:predicted O-linked N-acetylglucosamine transferase (SPINDLY family)
MALNVRKALLKAKGLARRGDADAAVRLYREILAQFPQNKQARDGLASIAGSGGSNQRPTALNTSKEIEHLIALYSAGRLQEALALGLPLVSLNPEDAMLLNLFGAICSGLGNTERAISSFTRAIELVPDFPGAYTNLASAYHAAGRHEEAISTYREAIRLDQSDGDNYFNLGNTLCDMGKQEQAVSAFLKAVELSPGQAIAWNNLGISLAKLQRFLEAVKSFEKAIEIKPDYADAHLNLGNTRKTQRKFERALASYHRAIELRPDNAEALFNQAQTYSAMKETELAISALSQAVSLAPDSVKYRATLRFQRAHLCDWEPMDADESIFPDPESQQNSIEPFALFHLQDTPGTIRKSAEFHASYYGGMEEIDGSNLPMNRSGPVRVGYFSADFHNHPVLQLLIRILELSDKRRVSQHAFSFGPRSEHELRHRVIKAVDKFHDVRNMRDREIAQLARSEEIDIAVDLTGYTRNSRSGIFAYRAAPIQVNYLGYPGTSGAPWMDYILADKVIIPEDSVEHYSEKIIYLPNCYMPRDNTSVIAATIPSRKSENLPDSSFVFCCFNKSYKFSKREFNIWMRLLGEVKDSVLWLKIGNVKAQENLKHEARQRGVNSDRLVFAGYTENMADHLARYRLADLFLDSFNHNAHTTANDALWAGLPIVTKSGASFSSRVCGSLLNAVNLPELITYSEKDYEELALELAQNPDKLSTLRLKLAENHADTPLFDSEGFTKNLESAFEQVHQRYVLGEPPGMIHV